MKKNNVDQINTREKQFLAAVCLRRFCKYFEINHIYVNQLISHLARILIAEDLTSWEKKGSSLKLVGRGDPIPKEVSDIVPDEIVDSFEILVQSCVEVGIVDMYGAPTDYPKKILEECFQILRLYNIREPDIEKLGHVNSENDGWGGALQIDEFTQLSNKYDVN